MNQEQLAAGYFKAHCLELMDVVNETGKEFLITKRGKPVAKLTPVASKSLRPLRGSLKGEMEAVGDIVGPIGEIWHANL